MAAAAAAAAAAELPSCIALRSQSNGRYLRYVHEQGENYGQLQLNATDTINPYSRYDVEVSRRHAGLVHIRCRYNRKYWVARRLRGDGDWCIAADADEPEEDLDSVNCTLIKPIITTGTTDGGGGGGESVTTTTTTTMTVRFVVAGSGDDKVARRMTFAKQQQQQDDAPCMRVVAAAATTGEELADALTVLNLQAANGSTRLLPRLVAFKDHNDDRLLVSRWVNGRSALQFVGTDIGDGTARFQVFHRDDGSVRIATDNPGYNTWMQNWNVPAGSGNWVQPNMVIINNNDTNGIAWFRVVQVSYDDEQQQQFAIRSVPSSLFCRRLTADGFTDCLNAASATITAEARLVVQEAILHREIHGISYRLGEARVYDTTVLTMATTAAVNDTSTENTKRLRLVYEEEEMSTWDATLELKLGYESNIRAGFPKLGLGGQVTISAEFFGAYNWGKTMEKKVRHEVEYEAAVPPRTKVTVMAIATRGVVDVPFDYWQRDIHIDGTVEQTPKNDGIYTGINSYNFSFETIEEKLPERTTITAAT